MVDDNEEQAGVSHQCVLLHSNSLQSEAPRRGCCMTSDRRRGIVTK